MIAAESKKSGLSSARSRRFLEGGWKEESDGLERPSVTGARRRRVTPQLRALPWFPVPSQSSCAWAATKAQV